MSPVCLTVRRSSHPILPVPAPRQNTTILLQRWHGGDRDALSQLLDEHLDWIRGFVHKRLGRQLRRFDDTGDFVQQVVLEFLRYGPSFCLEDGKSFRCLLGRIAVSAIRDRHRWWTAKRRDVQKLLPLQPGSVLDLDVAQRREPSPSQAVGSDERDAFLRLGLELLAPKEREIILLVSLQRLPYAEVSVQLELTEAAARQRHKRAVDALVRVVGRLRKGQFDALLDEEQE